MSWVTDQTLHESNIDFFVRVSRKKWHIENETFITLKNQGYEFFRKWILHQKSE